MKKVLLCLLGILLVIVEGSITNYLGIFGVSCNIVLIYITIVSLYMDELEIGIIATIVGLIKDIAISGIFGVNALSLFIIAYTISHLKNKIYKESSITILVLVYITSIFNSMVNIATVSLVYNTYTISELLLRGIIIIPILNSLLSVVLYNVSKKSILNLKED